MKQTAAIAAYIVLGIAVMLSCAWLSQTYLAPLLKPAAPTATAATSQPIKQGSEVRTAANVTRKAEEKTSTRYAPKQDDRPKVYRWKDAANRWHLSDTPPPPDHTGPVQVINVEL